jgi:hypothetical protein
MTKHDRLTDGPLELHRMEEQMDECKSTEKRGKYARTEKTKSKLRAKYESTEARIELGKLIVDALAKNKKARENRPSSDTTTKPTNLQLMEWQLENHRDFLQFEDRTTCDSENTY